MDEKEHKPQLTYALEQWAGRWPNKKWEARHSQAYWIALQQLDFKDVLAGMKLAAERSKSPEFTPSADSIRSFAIGIRNTRLREEERQKMAKAEQIALRSGVNMAPSDPKAAAAYIAEAGSNRFERLARSWECDSKRRGINPGENTPTKLCKDRMDDFWEMWAQSQVVKTEPKPVIDEQPTRGLTGKMREPGADDDLPSPEPECPV